MGTIFHRESFRSNHFQAIEYAGVSGGEVSATVVAVMSLLKEVREVALGPTREAMPNPWA